MTLDEYIKYAEEVAEENYNNAVYILDKSKSDIALENAEKYKRCAEEHIQLMEWLKELKQLRDQRRWIPISEKLPPEMNAANGYSQVWKRKVQITGYLSFDDKKELFVSTVFADEVRNNCVHDTIVTAWMPLPKPYKPQQITESEE